MDSMGRLGGASCAYLPSQTGLDACWATVHATDLRGARTAGSTAGSCIACSDVRIPKGGDVRKTLSDQSEGFACANLRAPGSILGAA